MQTAEKYSLYDQLMILPENLTGEILNGQLHTQPRPSGRHSVAGSVLGYELIGPYGPYGRGRGGPGGWWVLDEPEIHFIKDIEVAVPDLGGWRRQHMPEVPDDHRFTVVPDWICEILSPSTASKDREVKMPIYAHYGVSFAWLLDPGAQTLESYELRAGSWFELGRYAAADQVSTRPFEMISLELQGLWG